MSGDRSDSGGGPPSPLAGVRRWLLASPLRIGAVLALVLVATAAVAGGVALVFGGLDLAGPPEAGPPATATPAPTPTATPTPIPTPTPTATATAVSSPPGYRVATVTDTTTGGVVTVRFEDGRVRQLPLAAIDVPGAGGAAPTAFDGVVTGPTGRACLADAGRRAAVDLAATLPGRTVAVRVVDDETAPGATAAFVRRDGEVLNRVLVRRGDARATTDRYAAETDRAREGAQGLWSCGIVTPGADGIPTRVSYTPDRAADTGGLRVVRVRPNPPGRDAAALADETVTIRNTGSTTIDLAAWTLSDAAGHRLALDGATAEDRRLQPGEDLVVHTGAGQPRPGHRYLDAPNPVWDDDGDRVRLVTDGGDRSVVLAYGSAARPDPANATATGGRA